MIGSTGSPSSPPHSFLDHLVMDDGCTPARNALPTPNGGAGVEQMEDTVIRFA